MTFYWQDTDADYFSTCMAKGLFYVYDPEQLHWVKVGEKQHAAAIHPGRQMLYSSSSYLSIDYRHKTKVLKLQVFLLYSQPYQLKKSTAEDYTGNGADYRGF